LAIIYIITPEYPPQIGGVSDYTYQVANGLAEAGDDVHVWCPRMRSQEAGGRSKEPEQTSRSERVVVHRELGRIWPSDLRRVGKMLDSFPQPRRLLVQWVPHGFGLRAMNIPFCLWLCSRARKGDVVEIMAHECYLPFKRWAIKQNIAAIAQRSMTIILLRAARRVWVSIPAWETRFRSLTFGRRLSFKWLPVPSNIPVINEPQAIATLRARYGVNGETVLGHFGTYNPHDRRVLRAVLSEILEKNDGQKILLMGRGSDSMRDEFVRDEPLWKDSIYGSGELDSRTLSLHLSACDVMLQPCQDGVSGRRTTVMAALAHGKPIVTTIGCLTESIWSESEAVSLAPCEDTKEIGAAVKGLLSDRKQREHLRVAAHNLYNERFDIDLVITALRTHPQ